MRTAGPWPALAAPIRLSDHVRIIPVGAWPLRPEKRLSINKFLPFPCRSKTLWHFLDGTGTSSSFPASQSSRVQGIHTPSFVRRSVNEDSFDSCSDGCCWPCGCGECPVHHRQHHDL